MHGVNVSEKIEMLLLCFASCDLPLVAAVLQLDHQCHSTNVTQYCKRRVAVRYMQGFLALADDC